MEACIKFVKHTIRKCLANTDDDVNVALLQERSTQVVAELSSPAILLLNRPIKNK